MAGIGIVVTVLGFIIAVLSLGMTSSVNGRMIMSLVGIAVSLFGIMDLIIPAYNREALLPAAIGSVLRQTYKDFELLVWDDGSTDGTVAAAKKAAGEDPRVRLVASGVNQRVAKSLNAAARLLHRWPPHQARQHRRARYPGRVVRVRVVHGGLGAPAVRRQRGRKRGERRLLFLRH